MSLLDFWLYHWGIELEIYWRRIDKKLLILNMILISINLSFTYETIGKEIGWILHQLFKIFVKHPVVVHNLILVGKGDQRNKTFGTISKSGLLLGILYPKNPISKSVQT